MNQLLNDEIQLQLPHRYPFLMIDRVTDYEADAWIEGYKNISFNEPMFQGHFPDRPIFPGVLITEAMAQLSGLLINKTEGKACAAEQDYIFYAGMDNVRFKRMVVPGDRLDIRVEVLKHRRQLWKFSCTASVDGEVACVAEIMIIKEKNVDN